MPTLIPAADTSSGYLIYYALVGSQNFLDTLNFWVDESAISDTVDLNTEYVDLYDGYMLSVQNLYIEYALEDENDHNMICLYAKDACNCTICSGLYIDSDETI